MAEDLRSDSDLIAACLAGDPACWEALIRRYHRFLYALPLQMGLSKCDAEDVFQNACVKLYQNLAQVRETERLASWLAAVVRQEVALLRRRRPALSLDDVGEDALRINSFPGEDAPPEEQALALEDRLLVRAGLEELGSDCRSLLSALYSAEPASYAEVSERLGVPLGTIGPRRARCLQRLLKILRSRGW